MTDYTQWHLLTYRDGETMVEHVTCQDEYELVAASVADLLGVIDKHECTGPPPPMVSYIERCEHGAPIQFCRQHGNVTFPFVR